MNESENSHEAGAAYRQFVQRPRVVFLVLGVVTGGIGCWSFATTDSGYPVFSLPCFVLLAFVSCEFLIIRRLRFCTCGSLVSHPAWKIDPIHCSACGRLHNAAAISHLTAGADILDLSSSECLGHDALPLIKMFALTMMLANREKATQVTFEPHSEAWDVGFRIDNEVTSILPPPFHVRKAFTSTVKVLAGLDPMIEDSIQRGNIRASAEGSRIGIGVTTEPTPFGERIQLDLSSL